MTSKIKALDANKYGPHKSTTVSQFEHITMCNYHMESVKTMSHTHMKINYRAQSV